MTAPPPAYVANMEMLFPEDGPGVRGGYRDALKMRAMAFAMQGCPVSLGDSVIVINWINAYFTKNNVNTYNYSRMKLALEVVQRDVAGRATTTAPSATTYTPSTSVIAVPHLDDDQLVTRQPRMETQASIQQ